MRRRVWIHFLKDAPIPVSIMEEELEQESEIDVILREKKNATDARSTKLSHQGI